VMSAGPLTPSLWVRLSFWLRKAPGESAKGSLAMSDSAMVSWKRDQFTRGLKSGESAPFAQGTQAPYVYICSVRVVKCSSWRL
jgi:hypothetical protein